MNRLLLFISTSLFIISFIFAVDSIQASEMIGSEGFYYVKRGDTLRKISTRYGVSSNQILESNSLRNPNLIRPGQKLLISSKTIIPKKIYDGLLINLPEYKIYYFKNGVLMGTYPIAIGKRDWQTPSGKFFVENKTLNPTWRIPPRMAKEYKHKYKNKVIPPGPSNPLGKYWIGLSLPHIGIHSTNNPGSIGKARSHGCMRLHSNDAQQLFSTIDTGTQGEIIYEPIKVGIENGNVFIEVHKDIYNKNGDLFSNAVKILKEKRLFEYASLDSIKHAVDNKQGVPINISKNFKENTIYKESYRTAKEKVFIKPKKDFFNKPNYFPKRTIAQSKLATKPKQKKSTMLWNSSDY